ncbi:hypothetical protein ACJMK2_043968, partial [Sinanodonta woodiana]
MKNRERDFMLFCKHFDFLNFYFLASVPVLQASKSPQDSQEKVVYVEKVSKYEEGTTNMIKIPDSNEFIVFPTKPVIRHCINSGNRPCHTEGMQDNL